MTQNIITLADSAKVKQTIFDNFPTWAVCYAYYGADSAGDMSDEEIQLVDELLAEYGRLVSTDEDCTFDTRPLFGLACDVCTATFWKTLNR